MTTIETFVPATLWQAIQPLLPAPSPRYGGRPRVDDRAALADIVYQLRAGIPWRLLPARQLGCGRLELRPPPGSDGQRRLVEGGGHPPVRRLLSGQLVMSASKVLDKRMAGDDHPGTAIPLEAAHRSQPGLQAPMVSLDPVVGVPIATMPGRRQQLLQHDRVGGRLIGDHLDGSALGRADGPLEELAGRPDVAPPGDEHVDDLAKLVDRPVHLAPAAGDLHIGLVHLPAISNTMSARPSSLGQQRPRAVGLTRRHPGTSTSSTSSTSSTPAP